MLNYQRVTHVKPMIVDALPLKGGPVVLFLRHWSYVQCGAP